MISLNFDDLGLAQAEKTALRAAESVAESLRTNFGNTGFDTKTNERDWVTKWDLWAEERIASQLTKFSQDIGILGEETGQNGSDEVYWTIDAIDGTAGFVRGIDTCTTMISLVDSGEPVVSVINDFIRGIAYTAIAGGGAYKNEDEPLSVSSRDIKTAYLETYVPLDTTIGLEVSARLRAAGAFILQTASAGHMFTSIARGATEGFIGLQNPYATIWDYAPGALLVHEAGGMVANVGSDSYNVYKDDLIAANQQTYRILSDLIQEIT